MHFAEIYVQNYIEIMAKIDRSLEWFAFRRHFMRDSVLEMGRYRFQHRSIDTVFADFRDVDIDI